MGSCPDTDIDLYFLYYTNTFTDKKTSSLLINENGERFELNQTKWGERRVTCQQLTVIKRNIDCNVTRVQLQLIVNGNCKTPQFIQIMLGNKSLSLSYSQLI